MITQKLDSLLVTGANGFVGKSIVQFLGQIDEPRIPNEITLVTRRGLTYGVPEALVSRVRVIEQDLLSDWQFEVRASHIINLAADGSHSPYSQESSDSYVLLNKNLIEWVGRQEQSLEIFHASSGACFGYKPIDSSTPSTDSKSIFTMGRLKVEQSLKEFCSRNEIPLCIGRLFSFSGTNLLDKNQYAITSFIKSALLRNRIVINGNPLTVRSYLHQEPMAQWILAALTNTRLLPNLQIGSSDAVTIQELANFIALETGSRVEYSQVPTNGDIYVPENTETRIKLGVSEGLGWKEAVTEMISKARILNHGAN